MGCDGLIVVIGREGHGDEAVLGGVVVAEGDLSDAGGDHKVILGRHGGILAMDFFDVLLESLGDVECLRVSFVCFEGEGDEGGIAVKHRDLRRSHPAIGRDQTTKGMVDIGIGLEEGNGQNRLMR